jgi:membrane protein
MPTESTDVMAYIDSFVSNSGNLGLMGSFYVLFASIMFFSNYDFVINDIFETPKRDFKEGVKTYISLLVILPLLFGTSFYLSSIIQSYLNQNSITSIVHIYLFLPFLLIWGVFYIAYQISPNKVVSSRASVASSFIASLIWYIAKSGFVFYVLHNHTYSSIYGSISILLFFFLWIYISWVIFLHGLKFCYLLDKDIEITRI